MIREPAEGYLGVGGSLFSAGHLPADARSFDGAACRDMKQVESVQAADCNSEINFFEHVPFSLSNSLCLKYRVKRLAQAFGPAHFNASLN
jgi:hypothetical protein